MDIAFCTDNNYVMPCGITMVSLLENNQNSDLTIHIVGQELTSENQGILRGIVEKYKAKVEFYNITKERLEQYQLPVISGSHISVSAYIRLFLFDILPNTLEKILYLDCDLVILDDLSDLWCINIDNYAIAGIIDSPTFDEEKHLALRYNLEYPYINSGVLLINLKYWRNNNIFDKQMEYLGNNYENIKLYDQDVLNGALYDSIYILPIRYNMHNFFFRRGFYAHEYQQEAEEALLDPAIVHFTTSMKPWLKGCVHPLVKEYLSYKAISPWKDMPVTWGGLTTKRKIRYYKRIILEKLGIKKHKFVRC